jgi:hypothetical protein
MKRVFLGVKRFSFLLLYQQLERRPQQLVQLRLRLVRVPL